MEKATCMMGSNNLHKWINSIKLKKKYHTMFIILVLKLMFTTDPNE